EALRRYYDDESLAQLTALTRLQTVEEQRRHAPLGGLPAALRGVVETALGHLAQQEKLLADVLTRRFIQRQSVAEVARQLSYSERTVHSRQEEAIQRLAGLLLEIEDQALAAASQEAEINRILDGLPPPTFTHLIGVGDLLETLCVYLADPEQSWLVSVEGMGGSGKTALARQTAEDLVKEGRFQRVIWITARQQSFDDGYLRQTGLPALTFSGLLELSAARLHLPQPAGEVEAERIHNLRQALRQTPTLLVVDNLETAADVEALVDGLRGLARPTKVLITTRHSLAGHSDIAAFPVPALDAQAAQTFVCRHAQERHVPALLTAHPAAIARIAALCDGNPLAMALVVGQVRYLPLEQILGDLQRAKGRSADLLGFLFHYSWLQLSPTAQRLLLHMPLLDIRGVAWQELAAISDVPADSQFCQALEELIAASLLYAGFAQGQILYSIHRLTEYFILSDLI
ncbi:MAG TPA: NB-ARC domain-containing protein, partial [Caldilineaceae bacterium]|nr:NB-ARC domain-containing protein [Caldilineaceae bacterium]